MRTINNIVLHCTATPQTATIKAIQNYWKNNLKWKSPGYHFIIEPSGNIVNLWPIEKPSNGVAGHNFDSIHISYIGGVVNGHPVDNRTPEQREAMAAKVKDLKKMFPNAQVLGHRDFLIRGTTKWKDCPSFDVKSWLKSIDL